MLPQIPALGGPVPRSQGCPQLPLPREAFQPTPGQCVLTTGEFQAGTPALTTSPEPGTAVVSCLPGSSLVCKIAWFLNVMTQERHRRLHGKGPLHGFLAQDSLPFLQAQSPDHL